MDSKKLRRKSKENLEDESTQLMVMKEKRSRKPAVTGKYPINCWLSYVSFSGTFLYLKKKTCEEGKIGERETKKGEEILQVQCHLQLTQEIEVVSLGTFCTVS